MEPISTLTIAIASALAAGAAGGVTEVAKNAITDAYSALKSLLTRKFGPDGNVIDAVAKLESNPASDGRRQTLHEEAIAAKMDQDPEIMAAVRVLLNRIKDQPGGEQHIQHVQHAVGNYIAQADRGGTATVKVNRGER